jgi:TPR repeat protein
MKPLVPSFVAAGIALGAAGAQGVETIAVLELRSRVNPVVAAELSDRVREAVRRAFPQARIVDSDENADFVIGGKVSRGGLGYRAWLELRDRSGDVLQRASATASSRSELAEAIDGAAVDLVRSRQEAGGPVTIAPLPAVPAPAEPPEDALNLEADAGVLVAWDRARRIEAHGKERPEEAAAAWRRVAEMRGQNPFREIALTRAGEWEAYSAGRRAVDAQLASDTARLRRVLPLASVTDSAKIDLLVRFAAAHGFDKVSPLVALLPSAELRARAELSLDCEVKEAYACVQLARAADEAKDAKAALDYLDRACAAGAPAACAESGDRWLQGDLRDPARAIAALQRGCDASNAAACVRLARVHEEGDGAATDAKVAMGLREKACAAGDGRSCRRLAGMSEEPARVADLLRKGCEGGDAVSCALSAKEPAMVQRQLQEAASGAAKPAPIARPASATEKPAAKPPPPPPPRTEVQQSHDRAAAGVAMVAFGALAATAAVMMMSSDEAQPRRTFRSALIAGSQQQSGSSRSGLTLVFGGAAAISAGAGLVLLLTKPDKPEAPKVGVGVSPAGVVVSGNFR